MYVGMNRRRDKPCSMSIGIPHVCGDEPRYMGYSIAGTMVCPTYVGMNRAVNVDRIHCPCMPHVGGDEPALPGVGGVKV